MVETEVVEGPLKKVTHKKIVEAMQKMKSGKASRLSERCGDDSAYWIAEECLMRGKLVRLCLSLK